MKRTALLTLLSLLTVASFAAGKREIPEDWEPGARREQMQEAYQKAEEVELAGTLAFDRTRVIFKSQGKTFALKVPGINRYIYELDLQEGQELTIQGLLIANEDLPSDYTEDYDGFLLAQTVELDGKIYVLPSRQGGWGCGGFGNGPGKIGDGPRGPRR